MPLASRLRSFWRTIGRQADRDADLDAELQSAIDELTARYVDTGDDPVTARRRARMALGGDEAVKAEVRDVRIGARCLDWLRDVAFAWRGLRRTPGFALAAVFTLALGIGANTATFTLVNAILLQPLPYRQPDRLVFVWSDMTAAGDPRGPMSGPELADLREAATLFEGFGAIWATTAALTDDDHPQQLRIGLVTADFFSLLGTDPALGRTFVSDDEPTAAPAAILLSDGIWRSRYGADRAIVGRRILVNDQPATVVGVMPADPRLLMPPDSSVPEHLEAWLPFNRNMPKGPRGQMFLRVVGRMRPGVTVQDAAGDVSSVAERIGKQYSEYGNAGRKLSTVGLHADGVRDIRPSLLVLQGGVAVLLFIACVNVAGLLVARSAARSRETAVRLALGAGRGRLLSQCAAEGLVLAALGTVAGLVTAQLALAALVAVRPPSLDRIAGVALDRTVLALAAATTAGVALAFSLAPLAEMLRTDLTNALQQGARSVGRALHLRVRQALVVVQLALGVVLLVGAGLLVRTFANLVSVEPGFVDRGVLTFRVALPGSRYRAQEAIDAFNRAFEARLTALPGVSGAGAISHVPFDNVPNWSTTYLTEAGGDESLAPRADSRAVSPGAFRTMGASLADGRDFTEEDDQHAPLVAIVDEGLARSAWPGQSALGQRLATDPRVTGKPTVWVTVVGVLRHVRHLTVRRNYSSAGQSATRPEVGSPTTSLHLRALTPMLCTPVVREPPCFEPPCFELP
jgi:predicted permease